MSDPVVTPNQSYLMKQMQLRLAAALAVVMRDLGGNVSDLAHNSKPWEHASGFITPHSHWSVWNETFYIAQRVKWTNYTPVGKPHADVGYGFGTDSIVFSHPRWDPEQSNLDFGTKSVVQNVNERDSSKSKVIRNDTDDPVHVAYEESVDLTNSFSSSITKGVTLDVTKDASVDTSLTVKGEYAGVGAEATVAAHFGISQTKSSSSEIGKEQAEEGTKAESLSIDFDAKPRTYYLVEVTRENEQTAEPFDIDGVMDFDAALHFHTIEHWPPDMPHGLFEVHHYKQRPAAPMTFTGIDGLLQVVNGYDTRYGYDRLADYYQNTYPEVRAAIDWIASPESRRIQVQGTSYADLQSNADYDVHELGSQIPDELAHLPVVDADAA